MSFLALAAVLAWGTQPSVAVVSSDTLCARVGFKILTATSVQTNYPNRGTCTSGLVVIEGQATGVTVINPQGTPGSKVVALTPDSTDAAGASYWYIGGSDPGGK